MFFLSNKDIQKIIFLSTLIVSVSAYLYYAFHGYQNLGNYDAIARLNIARKVIDSLTPGVGQLGGIWLPIPQILMVPFVKFDFFWYTGLAGAFISGTVFIFSAVYLWKLALLLTKSEKASFLVWLMFMANINILFLQTMAMSEMSFMGFLIFVLYFLTKWISSHKLTDLLLTGIFVVLITLTRYEGYFVFIGSVIVVLIESIRSYWRENRQKVEGVVLTYLTLAGFGIFLWCVYSFLFYNDFLFWLHVYSAEKIQVSTANSVVTSSVAEARKLAGHSIGSAFQVYSQAIMWMNGTLIVFIGILGLGISGYTIIKNFLIKKPYSPLLPLLVISVILFALLVYGYHRGFIPPIVLPPQLLLANERKTFTIYTDSNIRYGIILAPCILLFAGYAASRRRFLYFAVIFIFAAQILVNFYKPDYIQYSLPNMWPYSTIKDIPWFKSHYDNGLVLISSNVHEDFMFQTGLPYSSFIYEGSREYWTESLNDPSKYVKWVIYDDRVQGDSLSYFFTKNARSILKKKFTLVYNVDGFHVYRKR